MTTPLRRWRLILVRLPPAGAPEVEQQLARPIGGPLPLVVQDGDTLDGVASLRDSLREAGATVAVVEAETGACTWHPTELAGRRCARCGAWTCATCHDAADGPWCPPCVQRRRNRDRNDRLRRYFALFLFAVFLFQVERWRRAEETALTPPVRVAIFQLVPPELADHPSITALNRRGEWLGRSLHDVGAFYDGEYRRYVGGGASAVQVEVYPPWTERVEPPDVLAPDLPIWTRLYRSWRYPRYFHDMARRHGVDPDDFGARVYAVYTDASGDVASDSRGSRRGRIGVSYLSVDERNLGYSVITVAHELGHVLGAFDRYDAETYLGTWPEGYVQPFAEPLWPQRWGEIMAVDIPTAPTTETEPRSLYMERVGYETAAELGWITMEQAEHFYTPRLEAPDSILDAIRRARDEARPARMAEPAECDPEADPTSQTEE